MVAKKYTKLKKITEQLKAEGKGQEEIVLPGFRCHNNEEELDSSSA